MSNEIPLHGNPSLRTRGHRPVLVERHYYVAAGQVELLGEARDLLSDASFPLLGRRAEERHGRAVNCRRCLAPCGDTVPEVAR